MIFATPGTLKTYLLKRLVDMSHIKVLAVDEADVLMDPANQQMGEQTKSIFK